MTEIALRQYENEIDHLIEEARYVEALAHTRHILRQHPRYINAYYLMGRIMLEADQPELAIDLFQRTLYADPEHLMARIGLTLAHQRLDKLNAAIWNLERAIELDPGNADLVDELRQLYGRRDGVEPDRIPLNRAALARLYIRGNRPGRAVEELRALLEAQPTRNDLRLALAEAYWRNDQIVQAADLCQRLLDDMRYCLKANLLLGALWVDSGQEEGQLYLKRAEELDPENVLANEIFGSASPLKPREITLERLAYRPGELDIDTQAKWFQKLEQTSVIVGIPEMMPEMTGAEARLVDITAGLEAQIEIPDWLRELGPEEGEAGWMAGIGAEAGAPETSAEVSIPEWLETKEAAEAIAGEATPDWLSSLAPEEAAPPVKEELEAAEALPDWLSELKPEEAAPEAELDWLQALGVGTATVEEVPLPEEGIPDWLREIRKPGIEAEAEAQPAAEELPGWLQELQPPMPAAETAESPEEEEIPEWLKPSAEAAEPFLATEEGELPDWLTSFQVEEVGTAETAEAAPEAAAEALPDWLSELEAAEAPERHEEIPTTEEIPDWLSALQPAAEITSEAEPIEKELLEWLADIEPEVEEVPATEEEAALPEWLMAGETSPVIEEAPTAEGFFGWETFGAEAAEVEAPAAEAPVEEELLEWEQLAEQAEAGAIEAPTAEGDFLSGDEALAWLESLTAGKEEELRAQAEAEAQARVAEILGRKPEAEAKPQIVAPETTPEATIEEAPAAEGFFGWETFGAEAAEVEAPAAEAPVEEELLEWEQLAEQVEAGAIEAPTAEGDFLSGDEALAWLESLTAGKEEELRAQAEAEAQARVAEILGRKPEAEAKPQIVAPEATVEEAPVIEEPFGWETFGAEAAEIEAPAEEVPVEEELLEWERLAEQIEEGAIEAPTAEGDFLSGDEALAWLESLAAGKEEELRAQAEAEAQARVAEILGHKPEAEAKPQIVAPEATPKATPEATPEATIEEAPAAEGFFGWETFGAEAAEVKATAEELPAGERLAEQMETGVIEVPTAEGDFLSGDEALAWLESLTAGKEEELRAQAEAEAQARVAEILGRKPEPKRARPVSPIEKPAPAAAEGPAPAKAEAALPVAEGEFLSGDEALAWLESLTAGKEEELRARAEAEAQARVAEILGRTPKPAPAPETAVPTPPVTAPTPPAEEVVAKEAVTEEVVPVAEGEFLSGDEALAWLESLAAGKEEELRARAEAEAQARVAEILGRTPKPAPAPETAVPTPPVTAPTPPAEEVVAKEAVTEEVVPVAEGEFLSGDEALAWLESLAAGKEEELRARAEAEAQARVAEILGRTPKPAPAPETAVPTPPVTAPTPPAEEVVAKEAVTEEVVPVAEGEFLSGDEALAWLESLAAGKEEELRARAEAETQARVAEILGRKPEPAPAPAPVEAPKPKITPPKAPVVEAVAEAPTPKAATPKPAAEAPAPKAVVTAPPAEAKGAAPDLATLRKAVARDESDHGSRLALARELWRTGATEEALTHYAYLIQAQAHIQDIVADLQQAAAENPQDATLLQTLGDAYMVEGLVDQALKVYERAMAIL
ncbi:MAG TPA: hypothetical protein PLN71_08370 [Anaerolineae bacterium]|nr:hypothetical protein [Anaerolineae bacterium]